MEKASDSNFFTPSEFYTQYLKEIILDGQKRQRRSGLFDMHNGYYVRVTGMGEGCNLNPLQVTCLVKNKKGVLVEGHCGFNEPDDVTLFSYKALINLMEKMAKEPSHVNSALPLAQDKDDLALPIVAYTPDLFLRPQPLKITTRRGRYAPLGLSGADCD